MPLPCLVIRNMRRDKTTTINPADPLNPVVAYRYFADVQVDPTGEGKIGAGPQFPMEVPNDTEYDTLTVFDLVKRTK